ncbi:kinase-like domain-containing protein [Rhizophagus diaphanus]|nr:kinase-like domain-containing protein [Rhizophagus diaphanus] [Rhizophagus sp. MUCL 43196]
MNCKRKILGYYTSIELELDIDAERCIPPIRPMNYTSIELELPSSRPRGSLEGEGDTYYGKTKFLEWVSFDKFTDIKKIGEGGFAEVYSATWIDGKSTYEYSYYGSWRKVNSKPEMKIALKRLNGSQNISDKYLNEVQFADGGNLRNILLNNFNNIMWKDKIYLLYASLMDLRDLHKLGYLHKDFHSANEQNTDGKVYGVMPYIAPEVLNGESDTSSSDIYSFGVVMAELPEIGKGTPEFYKKLAYKCKNDKKEEFAFNFTNLLTKPVNSSIITSYINEENDEVHDSQLVDLEISNMMQLEYTCNENNADDSIN